MAYDMLSVFDYLKYPVSFGCNIYFTPPLYKSEYAEGLIFKQRIFESQRKNALEKPRKYNKTKNDQLIRKENEYF